MMLITCPHCGARNASEFRYGGELHTRPDVNATDQQTWGTYLYLRDNQFGHIREWWYHRAGCQTWFIAERHTKTHEVVRTYLHGQEGAP